MSAQSDLARSLRSLRGVVYRAETDQLTGRNHQATYLTARAALRGALRQIVQLEDELGVDAVARQSDRLTDLRQRAVAAGLLSSYDVCDAEHAAIKS